ncbi:RlmE family RNA methyltransferase [Candidatus Bathyarchaeota archaeon]|nr:MAG: RlmE family RNA methyltransferase [Candidatus Bathyarchaeota archaeon]RJS82187.1 MAG: RlmE family RNA methyltransferase [Candidatus Bathyarchaeota archaeon]
MPKAWIQERKRDYYYKKAKEEKYRSRAAYKLLQAVKKYKFISKGDVVVDLGAAPGGWIQAASRIIGKNGFVLGVDLKPIKPFLQDNIQTVIGDINEEETLQQILSILPEKADVVISDVSPNISGIWEVDHARQIDLAEQSMKIALKVLKPSGNFFVKVFQGDMFDDFVKKVKEHFRVVKIVKPKASRAKSSEMFVLGLFLKPSS